MKDKKNLVIGTLIIIFCFICYISTFFEEDVTNNTNSTIENTEIISNEIDLKETQKEIYYEDDENINKYITLFNDMYPDSKITSDMLSVYHHHGSDHKDQVKLTLEELPIIITANFKDNISISIDNENEDNIIIKSLIKKFVKVFNSTITDEDIEKNIDSQDSGSNIDTFNDIEYLTNKDGNGERIIYIKITGELQ